jgi:hypothetical protein
MRCPARRQRDEPVAITDLIEATPLDAIAVDGSCERLEDYLAAYRDRYEATCSEFAAWDADKGDDWTPEIEDKLDEIE